MVFFEDNRLRLPVCKDCFRRVSDVHTISKWIELCQIRDKTLQIVKSALAQIFSVHGIPQKMVADNLPFNSYELQKFSKSNFDFLFSNPRYPRSNDRAENTVKFYEKLLREMDV